jgi:hypothetical protein
MNYEQDKQPSASGKGHGLDQVLAQMTILSPTAAAGGGDVDVYTQILAEFLAGVKLQAANWWRPGVDPEPPNEVVCVYTGKIHYRRIMPGCWQAITRDDDSKIHEHVPWAEIPAPLVVDSSRVEIGTFKMRNPHPGGPVADWQTTTAEEARVMLEQALAEMERRIATGTAAGTIATRWTPSDHGPVILLRLSGRPGAWDTDGD